MPPAKRRRSRQVDKQEVRATGWAWFIVGVLLALFFGGAVRALFSEKQVRHWITKTLEREAPPYDIHIGDARILLSDGIWPRLGLQVSEVEIKPQDLCKVPLQVRFRQAFLPVNVIEALGGRLKFGRLKIEGLRVLRLESECAKGAASGATAERPLSTGPATAVAKPRPPRWVTDSKLFFSERWGRELAASQAWFEGVDLVDLRVDGLKEPMAWIEIGELQASLLKNPDRVEVEMSFRPGKGWDAALGGPPLDLEMRIERSEAELHLSVPVGEGNLKVETQVRLADMSATGEAVFDFVPAAQITTALRRWKVLTDPLEPKRTWLTGRVKMSQGWEPENQLTMDAENLRLSGEPGEILVPALHLETKNSKVELQPFVVEMKKFSLQHLLAFLGRKGYSGVIKNFGSLSGRLTVASQQEMGFSGEVSNLELAFSRRSVRAQQRFTSFRGELTMKDGRVSGIVNDFVLQDGLFKGLVSFNLDRRLLDGVFQIRIDELQFQPEVQRIMLSGLMAPLALYGQGRLEGGQVSTWSGELGTSRIDADAWSVDTLKLRSEFANGQMALSVRANGAELMAVNPLWEKLKPALASETTLTGPLQFKHLSGRIEIVKGGGRWRNMMGTLRQGEILVSSFGNWLGNSAEGLVSFDVPGAKSARWDLQGPWLDLRLEPSQRSARDLKKLEQ